MLDVRQVTGDEIIDRDHAVAFGEQAIGQVRAEETGAAGDDRDGALAGIRGHGALLKPSIAVGEQKRSLRGAHAPRVPCSAPRRTALQNAEKPRRGRHLYRLSLRINEIDNQQALGTLALSDSMIFLLNMHRPLPVVYSLLQALHSC
jgi:hypothetical protein